MMDDLSVRPRPSAQSRLTFSEYWNFYSATPGKERWELIDGEAIKVAPPTRVHQRIADNIWRLLRERLEVARPDWHPDREVGVHVPEDDDYAPEPDVTVSDTEIGPNEVYAPRFYFAVEVISAERETVLSKKQAFYEGHAHSRGYMLVSQVRMSVEIFRRSDSGWSNLTIDDPDAVVDLPEIGPIGRLKQFYERTPLAQF